MGGGAVRGLGWRPKEADFEGEMRSLVEPTLAEDKASVALEERVVITLKIEIEYIARKDRFAKRERVPLKCTFAVKCVFCGY